MHPMAWAFVAMAAGFGAVAAWFLFSPKPVATTETSPSPGASVTSTADSSAAAPDSSVAAATTADPTAVVSGQPAGNGGKSVAAGGTGRAPASAKPKSSAGESSGSSSGAGDKPEPKPCTPDDPFCGQAGVDGPSAGTSDTSGGSSASGLSQEQLQSVVNRNRRSVSRKCLALVRSGSARVNVTITVSPSGSVASVATSGGKGHAGLAGCVASRVRNWRFPTAGASTVVNVPFTFIAQ